MSEEQAAYGEKEGGTVAAPTGGREGRGHEGKGKEENGRAGGPRSLVAANGRDGARPSASGAPEEFRNRREAAKWLQEQGWKVSQSTLYKHFKDGRLRPNERGAFEAKALEKYAIQYLMRMTDAEHVKAERLAEKREKAEIRLKEAQAKTAELKQAILEGRYVERQTMYLELASRAAVLDAGIKATIQLRAEAWVAACSGDHGRVAELIRAAIADMDELVNSFSTTRRFHVIYRGGEEGDRRQKTEDRMEEEEFTAENAAVSPR